MTERSITVVGAGVCGLYTALLLAENGWKVTILEATGCAGGRIRSTTGAFGQAIEAGAEFVHGGSPITRKLARRAGARIEKNHGRFFRTAKGMIVEQDDTIPDREEFMNAAGNIKKDMTLEVFLNTHFAAESYKSLRDAARRMAEGFDAADASRVSVKSLYEEWSSGNAEEVAALDDGYVKIVKFLTAECLSAGCDCVYNAVVTEITWQPGKVQVRCSGGRTYDAGKVVVTASLGALLAEKVSAGHISFVPDLTNHRHVAAEMGYGPVVKVIMEFNARFWSDRRYATRSLQNSELGFLMNDGEFPVYWFHPLYPVVTAWAGGSQAAKLIALSDKELAEQSVGGLAAALNAEPELVNALLANKYVNNWANDPYARGAYSYTTPGTANAKRILKKPVADTIYFAGEALGKSHGTVEAALESARYIAKKIR